MVRLWKPELEAFGFVFRNGFFRYRSRKEGHLDLAVSVQRNTRSETYKINPSILLRNTLLESAPSELLVLANLRVDGIFLSDFEQGEIGPDLFRHACLMGLEGLVSKHKDRPYRAGRSPHWVKMKNPKHPAMTRVQDAHR